MLELIKYIVEQFAEEKDAISYDVEETEDTITVTVLLAESDMGKVIGKQGKIAKALRTLVRAATPKGSKKYKRGDQGTPSGVTLFSTGALRKKTAERLFAFFCASGVFQEGKGQKRMRNRRQRGVFLCKLRFGRGRSSTKCTKNFPPPSALLGGKGLQKPSVCGII